MAESDALMARRVRCESGDCEDMEPKPLNAPLRFKVCGELAYQLFSPTTFLFSLRCLKSIGHNVISESMNATTGSTVEEFRIAGSMNRFTRINAEEVGNLEVCYEAEVEVGVRIVDVGQIPPDGAPALSPDTFPYLFPSRYCQSDRLRQQANAMFGHLKGGHAIASGVSDWIFENIAYVSGSSRETCSAVDTMELRQGVCRDFAHLGIAFCRALNVPARYVTAYAHQLNPQDFHACFEAYIGGCWYLFDPTHLAPLNGLVRIAAGRDAADTAVCTIFGDPLLIKSRVACGFVGECFIPVTRDTLVANNQLIALT